MYPGASLMALRAFFWAELSSMRGNLSSFDMRDVLRVFLGVFWLEGCVIALLVFRVELGALEGPRGLFWFSLWFWVGVGRKFLRYFVVVRAARPVGMKRLAQVGKGVR